MLGALSGVAKRLAITMAPADFTSEDGAAKLVALLSTRFGGQSGAKSMAAYNGLHRCVRRGQPMEEYLVMFDEAALRCDEEGCPITNATKAHIVLNQANLTDNEQAMAMTMANKGSVNTVKYEDMTGALLTLFGDEAKTGTVALVALPAGGRVPRPPRRAPGGGNGVPAGTSLCWYCNKTGHIRKDCHLKAKHQRERGVPDGGAVDVGSVGAEIIHMVVLAGTTAPTWSTPVGEAILDPGAKATVAGKEWVVSFVEALSASERNRVTSAPTDTLVKFGAGPHVAAVARVVLLVCLGPGRFLVRVLVVPGGLPLLISRPTLTSLGANMDFVNHVLHLPTAPSRCPFLPSATTSSTPWAPRRRRRLNPMPWWCGRFFRLSRCPGGWGRQETPTTIRPGRSTRRGVPPSRRWSQLRARTGSWCLRRRRAPWRPRRCMPAFRRWRRNVASCTFSTAMRQQIRSVPSCVSGGGVIRRSLRLCARRWRPAVCATCSAADRVTPLCPCPPRARSTRPWRRISCPVRGPARCCT